jgi:hypothetical protein
LLASVRDPHAHNVGLSIASGHALALRGCESSLDQFGHHVDREPVSTQDSLAAAETARASNSRARRRSGLDLNEHMEGDGETVFRHASKLGLEGIVSKRKDSSYRSGRSPDWLKMKNADAPAVKREAEEDWGKERWR